MSFSSIFIRRPIATTLLTIGLALAGMTAFFLLPVASMPNADIPTIFVSASMAGASPETMSTSVATPLERHLGTISDVTEMTSRSSVGATQIVLQFGLDRDIDGAARDVQAAISAARADLPTSLKANPTYRKLNPASAPILIMALTSDTLTPGQIYDSASTNLQQKLSQVDGIGQVQIAGSSLPAVRVDLNPRALFKYGIALEDVRAALSAANANAPKGAIEQGSTKYQVGVNDQARTAGDYQTLIVAYRNNAAVRLRDVAKVSDGVEDVRNIGMANGKPAINLILSGQPGANIIDTVNAVKALLPELRAAIPPSIKLDIVNDRTGTIRASVHDVEITMLISIVLVVFVVFLFLRSGRASIIPSIAVPLSLMGTFGVMYFAGLTLDNLSLMALTVATGFVVDDAIVVLENITRHIEEGMSRFEATLLGAREVGFTVLSMSLSLIAVFVPITLMGGIVGRFFNEFGIVLSSAVLISLVVSLTTTPMLCANLDLHKPDRKQGWLLRNSERGYQGALRLYDRTLQWALDNPGFIMFILLIAVLLNFYLYIIVPKGFIPVEDTGDISGGIRADQSISFQLLEQKFTKFVSIVSKDPAVQSVVGFAGGGGGGPRGGGSNSGNLFVQLKPKSERGGLSTDQVIDRMRAPLSTVAGAQLFLRNAGGVPGAGGRQGNGAYQYSLQADTLDELNEWVPKITNALQDVPELEDVNSDREDKGLEVELTIDRATAARLGITASQIDNTLYDAFGQRQVSTIYNDLNQYHVVMGVAPEFWQSPETLKDIYVSTAGGAVSGTAATGVVAGTTLVAGQTAQDAATIADDAVRNQQLNALTNSARGGASTAASVSTKVETMVPLAAFSSFSSGTTPLSINHQGPFVATTFSFNLAKGVSIGQATAAIQRTMGAVHAPVSIHGDFAGSARIFQQSLSGEPLLILAAILTVYLVLGILYESYVHPLTILSTLPSAGVGALFALLATRKIQYLLGMPMVQFDLFALIGILLLIGIVKKNAIMMIDFALVAEREQGLSAHDAIYNACLLRFRPIMMTTFAAILGAMPLAIGYGTGSELRQPLGIAIVGGLIVSQLLTLYTTPVVYIYLDRFRLWAKRCWDRWYAHLLGDHRVPQAGE